MSDAGSRDTHDVWSIIVPRPACNGIVLNGIGWRSAHAKYICPLLGLLKEVLVIEHIVCSAVPELHLWPCTREARVAVSDKISPLLRRLDELPSSTLGAP